MNWIVLVITLLLAQREGGSSPTPLKLPGHTQRLSPYIRHWEAANFDRAALNAAHQKHIEQKHQRRKRDLDDRDFGRAHFIRLKFNAHDREFRLVLRQDPLSVFASDAKIENTQGPLNYDISRIYTGSLEDDENSHVHAVLTSDNLLDGTIETKSEHFYLEPAHRYSKDLHESGVHSIVYKLSDVNSKHFGANPADPEHCASDRLHRYMSAFPEKIHSINKTTATTTTTTMMQHRHKRWLPDEFSESTENHQNPPLPLDLDMPYNDDFNIFSHITNKYPVEKPTESSTNYKNQQKKQPETVITWQNNSGRNRAANSGASSSLGTPTTRTTATTKSNIVQNNRNINDYNRKRDSHLIISSNGNSNSNSNNNNYNNNNNNYNNNRNEGQNPFIISRNLPNYMTNVYRNNNYNQSAAFEQKNRTNNDGYRSLYNSNNNNYNNNSITKFVSNDRPSHKTHVEIITKNGATKKPNIIVNNYNPDIVLEPTLHNTHYKNVKNFLIGRGQEPPMDMEHTQKSNFDRKITCMLYLQADHTFFQKMGSDEASIEAITRHVQRVNSIYKNTDFNRDGKPDNITFMIKRIKVHNMNAVNDPTYRFPGNYGVEKFLELFSEEDYDAFCLAYMFTYRDFEMGTLGLAWTGDLKNAGGVCEKNGHYRGSLKSLNTGIVTLLNYGKHVPPAVSHVTLAHEIGHNFGSPHDPDQCTPGGEDGNFIMFARATSGDKKNNHKFSPCSLKSIDPVLSAKARSNKGCFTEPQTSICGNGVVEPGEQCDCGWEEDCKDTCCFPMSRHHRIDEKPCTLTPSAMCSPSQGPCCTGDCKLKFGDKCRDDNGCRDPSFCDGRMPQCPPSLNKPNKTICNKEFVCYMGECTGSICLAYGLESCQCIPTEHDDKIKSCELCCKLPGEGNPCRSSFEWNEPPFDVPDMYAKPGTPCNDYNGYCDVFQKCREVDPSGPLATLRKLLLSEESIATFKKWMQQNWYTVAFAVLGVIMLLILSTKLLAKRSNLKLKSVTIIHSATTETVRLPDDNNDVIVHTAVRTKVPFKKKVRGERVGSKSKNMNSGSGGVGGVAGLHKSKSNNAVKTFKTGLKATQSHNRGTKGTAVVSTVVTAGNMREKDHKKVQHGKKNRIEAAESTEKTPAATTTTAAVKTPEAANSKEVSVPQDLKKSRKFKRSKEVIDYSSNNTLNSTTGARDNYTNTFSKVQKWLLESPIVAQPLSRIEHSTKMMSKSQSTPERLLQKSPQKSKAAGAGGGLGGATKEKVKLQVVYKPPFKFSLRMSKQGKIKTHVVSPGVGGGGGGGAVAGGVGAVGGGAAKRTTKTVIGNDKKRTNKVQNGDKKTISGGDKANKAILMVCPAAKESKEATPQSVEPNYETLNPKTTNTKLENVAFEKSKHESGHSRAASGSHAAPTTSGSGLLPVYNNSERDNSSVSKGSARLPSVGRPNSLLFNSRPSPQLTSHGSLRQANANLDSPSHQFNSSTQNLISNNSHNDLPSVMKSRGSKLNGSRGAKESSEAYQIKRSTSNMNLRRDSTAAAMDKLEKSASSTTANIPSVAAGIGAQQFAASSSASRRNSYSVAPQKPTPLPNQCTQSITNSGAHTADHSAHKPYVNSTAALPRPSRHNFSNIPRVSISSNSNSPTASSNNSLSNFSFNGPLQPLNSSALSHTEVTTNSTHSHIANGSGNGNANSYSNKESQSFCVEPRRPSRQSSLVVSSNSAYADPAISSSSNQQYQHQQQQQQHQRSNSLRQQLHNHHPPPPPPLLSTHSISAAGNGQARSEQKEQLHSTNMHNFVS